jgi:hypothetical protein
MMNLSFLSLTGLISLVVLQTNPLPASSEEITKQWLQEVFERAYVTVEIDEDGDLALQEAGSLVGWVRLDQTRKTIELFTMSVFRGNATRDEKLEFINNLNNNVLGATFYVAADSVLVADSYIYYEPGLSDKQLVHQYHRFRDAVRTAWSWDKANLLK